MPKRPSKKGMEFNIALWNADHPSEHVIEEEDGETVAEEVQQRRFRRVCLTVRRTGLLSIN